TARPPVGRITKSQPRARSAAASSSASGFWKYPRLTHHGAQEYSRKVGGLSPASTARSTAASIAMFRAPVIGPWRRMRQEGDMGVLRGRFFGVGGGILRG